MKKYLILIFPMLLINVAKSNELCVSYTQGNNIVFGLQEASTRSTKNIDSIFNQYIEATKKNDKKAIIESFSKEDGSYLKIGNMLNTDPSKYSLFSGLDKIERKHAFLWGNYILVLSKYHHKTMGSMVITDAFYCNNNSCKLSSLFEASEDPAVSLLSRFISNVDIQEKQRNCPKTSKQVIRVFPEKSNKSNVPTLRVLINFAVKPKKLGSLKNLMDGSWHKNIRQCREMLVTYNQHSAKGRNTQKLEKLTEEEIAKCAMHMDKQSLVPVYDFSKKEKASNFFTPFALVDMLAKTSDFSILSHIKSGQWDVYLVLAKPTNQSKYLLVLPMLKKDGLAYFDWEYFWNGEGELFASEYFGKYLKSILP